MIVLSLINMGNLQIDRYNLRELVLTNMLITQSFSKLAYEN